MDGSTNTPLGPGDIAALQKQLDDAAARVAKVQAQLAQATGGPSSAATSGAPAASGASAAPGQPVVLYAGQPGQPVDLEAILGAQRSQQVREALAQLGNLGLAHQLSGLLPDAPASVEPVAPLIDPPRHVPFTFRLSALEAWSWWEAFGILMGLVAPIALWGFFPQTLPAGLIVGLLVIAGLRIRRYVVHVGLLKWGKVATVTNSDELSRGTYYSGTTYNNMLVRQAVGWKVTKRFYSGPASKTKITYSVDGVAGELILRGLPYAGGVILADSRKPSRARCVSAFPYAVEPDAQGQYVGGLGVSSWIGVEFALALHLALAAFTAYAVQGLWLS